MNRKMDEAERKVIAARLRAAADAVDMNNDEDMSFVFASVNPKKDDDLGGVTWGPLGALMQLAGAVSQQVMDELVSSGVVRVQHVRIPGSGDAGKPGEPDDLSKIES